MELKELNKRAQKIKHLYETKNRNAGNGVWKTPEYLQGFVGDVGDLAKLIMAKQGFRSGQNTESRIEHELADCLWSILVIAEEEGIDLEKSFINTMDELENKLKHD